MSHNSDNELVLDSWTENEITKLVQGALQKKVWLTSLQRDLAIRMGLSKALDQFGNIDVARASALMTQAGTSKRISPNVLAAGLVYGSDGKDNGEVAATNKTRRGAGMTKEYQIGLDNGDVARCARYCQRNGTPVQGRNCRVCKGAGYGVSQSNQSRNLVPRE